ncbi:hypothetical protein O4090_15815 [Dietzia kunjamensis]|uniref:hypothetical protein n=1 Tax=Dietzia kunjamensis TaxID=322509 RepID=UPI0022B37DE8|nr:hypothetical protein [Dietzia kunjamensis]MCZ4657418.1 hypothetical protein [Dietzia kunjamensis]
MAAVTTHFAIPDPVPFVDVELSRDNEQFIDLHRIRLVSENSVHLDSALACVDTFLTTISTAAMSGVPRLEDQARELLQQFSEPRETRLGLARKGFNGHGGADDIGARIWRSFTTDLYALLQVGVLKYLEELPLFIEGIDRDLTSDITTRIVFGPLADFTAEMLATYPQFSAGGHSTVTIDRQVWDATACMWTTRRMTLPAADGKPILLVPRSWVSKRLLMSSRRFHGTTLLSYVQEEQASISPSGKVVHPSKVSLRRRPDLRRGRRTNIEVTLRAHEAGADLLRLFHLFVEEQLGASGDLAA